MTIEIDNRTDAEKIRDEIKTRSKDSREFKKQLRGRSHREFQFEAEMLQSKSAVNKNKLRELFILYAYARRRPLSQVEKYPLDWVLMTDILRSAGHYISDYDREEFKMWILETQNRDAKPVKKKALEDA